MGCLGLIFALVASFFVGFATTSDSIESTAMVEPAVAVEVTSASSDDIYAAIPQSRTEDGAFVLGDPDAPVTLIAFEDFLCPHCQNYQPTIHEFINIYVVTGQAKFEYRMFPVVDTTYSPLAARLAECADKLAPGSFWQAHDMLFEIASAARFSDAGAREFADRMMLDYAELLSCSQEVDQVSVDTALARELGVTGTPAIFIQYGDATPVSLGGGAQPFEVLADAVENAE